MDPEHWPTNLSFLTFSKYVQNLPVINDCVERGVRLIADFIDMTYDEEQTSALLQVVEYHCNMIKFFTKDNLSKC